VYAETLFYNFGADAPMSEVSDSLGIAELAAKAIHGPSRYRLDAHFVFDPEARYCRIDAVSDVGRDLATIFTAFLVEQLGDDGFTVTKGTPR
jgi:hypothetical protein